VLKKYINKAAISESLSIFMWLLRLCFTTNPIESTLFLTSAALQTLLGIFGYFATAKITTILFSVIAGTRNSHEVWKWFILLVLSSLLANICYRINHSLDRRIYFNLTRWSSLTFARQLCTIDLKDFYNSDIRNTITRLNQGATWQLPNAAYFSLAICQSIFNTLVTTITIGLAVWWLVPVFVVLLIPMLINESKLSGIGWFVFSNEGDGQHIFWGIMSVFQEVKKQFEIRALGASKRLLSMLDSLTTRFYKAQIKEVNKTNRIAALAILAQFLREGVAQGWLLARAISRSISIESYLFNVSMVFRLDGAISGTFSTIAQMNEGAKYAVDFRAFMNMKPTIIDSSTAIQIKKSPPKIEFINVSFKYPESHKNIFTNLSFVIGEGEKVALVGENGAGKSTIVKLLLRFYELESGRIEINGINIQDIEIDSLLNQLAVLFQDFNQYTMTVKDNIAISDSSIDMNRVRQAASLSGALEVIESLPKKFDTYLNPSIKDGVELSGGQWQKIALARAFYRDANIMILDEPTSAIDAKAEYEIFNNIFERHDSKTALIISHRFSTVRKADRIVVLDKGNVVENGTHNDLLELEGLYAEMFNKQAEGYR
jgi:ATP-binding cassette subfamily B protein